MSLFLWQNIPSSRSDSRRAARLCVCAHGSAVNCASRRSCRSRDRGRSVHREYCRHCGCAGDSWVLGRPEIPHHNRSKTPLCHGGIPYVWIKQSYLVKIPRKCSFYTPGRHQITLRAKTNRTEMMHFDFVVSIQNDSEQEFPFYTKTYYMLLH